MHFVTVHTHAIWRKAHHPAVYLVAATAAKALPLLSLNPTTQPTYTMARSDRSKANSPAPGALASVAARAIGKESMSDPRVCQTLQSVVKSQ